MSNKVDRALGIKPFNNANTVDTKMAVRNTQVILARRRKPIKLKTVLIVVAAIFMLAVLYKTAPAQLSTACALTESSSNFCKD